MVSKLQPPDKWRKCSVSTSIAGDSLLGPYFLPPCLTGAAYHSFLQNVLPELLQDVALQSRIHLLITHADAPPHFLLTVQEFLNNVFPERWIGQSGLTAWPDRSTDWNPYILSLGTSKVHCLSYESQWYSQFATTNTECIWDGIFHPFWQSLFRHTTLCTEAQDLHFEHFL